MSVMLARHWLDARVDRVAEERALRVLHERKQGPLFDVLVRVQEDIVVRARAREERFLVAMAQGEMDSYDLGNGWRIERRSS